MLERNIAQYQSILEKIQKGAGNYGVNDAIQDMGEDCELSKTEVHEILEKAYFLKPHLGKNARDAEKRTPLINSARLSNLFAVEWLLLERKDKKLGDPGINLEDKQGKSALIYAVAHKDTGAAIPQDIQKKNLILNIQRKIEELLLTPKYKAELFLTRYSALSTASHHGNVRFLNSYFNTFFQKSPMQIPGLIWPKEPAFRWGIYSFGRVLQSIAHGGIGVIKIWKKEINQQKKLLRQKVYYAGYSDYSLIISQAIPSKDTDLIKVIHEDLIECLCLPIDRKKITDSLMAAAVCVDEINPEWVSVIKWFAQYNHENNNYRNHLLPEVKKLKFNWSDWSKCSSVAVLQCILDSMLANEFFSESDDMQSILFLAAKHGVLQIVKALVEHDKSLKFDKLELSGEMAERIKFYLRGIDILRENDLLHGHLFSGQLKETLNVLGRVHSDDREDLIRHAEKHYNRGRQVHSWFVQIDEEQQKAQAAKDTVTLLPSPSSVSAPEPSAPALYSSVPASDPSVFAAYQQVISSSTPAPDFPINNPPPYVPSTPAAAMRPLSIEIPDEDEVEDEKTPQNASHSPKSANPSPRNPTTPLFSIFKPATSGALLDAKVEGCSVALQLVLHNLFQIACDNPGRRARIKEIIDRAAIPISKLLEEEKLSPRI